MKYFPGLLQMSFIRFLAVTVFIIFQEVKGLSTGDFIGGRAIKKGFS
jgi:hypothetical protein